MKRSAVVTAQAPAPAGPYSQAIRKGNILALAGQLGIDPATGTVASGVREQVQQALQNVQAVLAAAGADFGDVVMIRVYLADPGDFAVMNEVYASFLQQPAPARTTVFVDLPGDYQVEVDALAVLTVPGPLSARPDEDR
jgi:2-iminobutanoate/2-iminopropanoate deaminase